MTILLRGSGGGGGGSSQGTTETRDSLHSSAKVKILDIVSEGPIYGFVDKDNPLKCVYYNGTRVQNDDGSFNFNNVIVDSRVGTPDQDYIRGFESAESETSVGLEIKDDVPWVHAFSNLEINAVNIILRVPALTKVNQDTNQIGGHRINYVIEISVDGGGYTTVESNAIVGKTTGPYDRGHRIELPEATTGWTIRVRRTSPNANSATIADTLQIASYSEIIDGKFRYPYTALVSNILEAEQFPSVPTRGFHLKGRIINVPTNYDPETREYTGVWDGTFKLAYSNNPAWVFYDYVVNDRFGVGHRVDAQYTDKWTLYVIAKYCDELVDDGFGGQEPRFTCNNFAEEAEDATRFLSNLASVFRGIMYTAQGSVFTAADMPGDPEYLYTQANVIDGLFTYSGSGRKVRHTVALVSWNDMSDMGRAKIEYVDDKEGIARYGVQKTEVIATGCTSRGQARRQGKMILTTERYETDVCKWSVGLDGTVVSPGKIVKVADAKRAGRRMGGRIRSADVNGIVVDQLPVVGPGDKLSVILPNAKMEERTVSNVIGDRIEVSTPFSESPIPHSVWVVESTELSAQLYRVLAVTESDDGMSYDMYGLQHVPNKYAYVEQNIKIDEYPTRINRPDGAMPYVPNPPDLDVVFRDVTTQNTSQKAATITWGIVPQATGYKAVYRQNEGNWTDIAGVITANSVELYDVVPGELEVGVSAVNADGHWSLMTYAGPFMVDAVATPPGFVADLEAADQSNAQAIAQEIIDRGAAITAEATTRANEIQAAADAAALDATNKANAAKDAAIAAAASYTDDEVLAEANARADALIAERNAWEAAVETEQLTRQTEDESLATAISLVSAGSGEQFDSKKIWYFDSDLESWTSNGGAPTIVDGWLRAFDHASNPLLNSPNGALGIPGESYRFVKLRIKKVGNPTWRGELWWQTAADPTWTSGKSVSIPEPSFDANGVSAVVWQDIPWWPNTIDRIRLRLSTSQDASNYFLVDWIAVGRPTPGAGVSLVQEETAARIAADSAEASQRNTLAVQLRGSYTGTSLAGVASGLIYDEREARVSADASQVSRISTMEARMPTGSGLLATSVSVTDEANARATADTALGNRISTIEARVPTGTDMLANEARVVSAESASVSRDNALGSRIGVVEARMPTGSDMLANEARVVSAEQAAATATSAVASDLDAVEARMPSGTGKVATEASVTSLASATAAADAANANAITALGVKFDRSVYFINGDFEQDEGWTINQYNDGGTWVSGPAAFYSTTSVPWSGTRVLRFNGDATPGLNARGPNSIRREVTPGKRFRVRFMQHGGNNGGANGNGVAGFQIRFMDKTGATINYQGDSFATVNGWVAREFVAEAPANSALMEVWYFFQNVTQGIVSLDALSIEPLDPATVANGQAIDAINLAIDQQDDFIQGVADDLEALDLQIQNPTTGLASKTSSTDFTTLKNRVDTVGGGIESIASNVTSVTASLEDLRADSVVVRNPSFERNEAWSVGGAASYYTAGTATLVNSGNRSLKFDANPSTTTVWQPGNTPAKGGQKFRARMAVRHFGSNVGAEVRLGLRQYTADGTYISTAVGVAHVSAGAAFYTDVEGEGTLHADCRRVEPAIYVVGGTHTTGSIYVDDVDIVLDNGARDPAMATALQTLDAQVNNPTTGLATKASATALNAVQATVGNNTAAITQVSNVLVESNAVPIINPSFERDEGWGTTQNNPTLPSDVEYFSAASQSYYFRSGKRALKVGAGKTVYNTSVFRATSGERFRVGGHVRSWNDSVPGAGQNARIGLRAYDADGNYIASSAESYVIYTGTGSNFGYKSGYGYYTVPDGAVYVSMYLSHGAGTGYFLFDDVFCERLSGTDERVLATYALKLDANDKVASIVAMNDGTESEIVFDFDRVSFLSSNGGSFISGDTIEQRAGGYLYVTGAGFGANSDLVMWYGLDRDPATCTKANAIAYADTTGKYFVQDIVVGDIEFTANSNSVASPHTLQMVNNQTNGGSKVITATYSFWGFKYSSKIDLPTPSGSATLSLWRKVGAGAFVQLGSTVNVTFTGTAEYDPMGGSTAELRGEGSITFTDTDTSLSDHIYEWRLTSRTNSIPPNSQSMTLKSVE